MMESAAQTVLKRPLGKSVHLGLLWLLVATVGALVFLSPGLDALRIAWALPEYSHAPLIPILSGFLFLRQLKDYPERPGPIGDRWVGVSVVTVALVFGALARLANIDDLAAYALILWVGGILLISFGWSTGKHFWPPVLHLIYMLPLPDTLYYKMSTWLQLISSELGVWLLRLLSVPVFLDGNIIDLGVTKLHVAEACSGLRYLFPILSFSYIFAVLYKGPTWHKAVLLIAAAPITVIMNSVRIAIAGTVVNYYGLDWLDGFTHFFEGWVIFVACVMLLFGLARIMLFFNPVKMSLTEALDLETEGLWTQAKRIRLVQPSAALITAAILAVSAVATWQIIPERGQTEVTRERFALFPRTLGDWRTSPHQRLDLIVEETLGADDYRQVNMTRADGADVGLFMAWYADQGRGGVHSPEICLPGSGWEIAWLERVDIASEVGSDAPFLINRAIVQQGEVRMMVFYWFDQKGRKVAWDLAAKFWLMIDGIRKGRTDGALIRLTTPIGPGESDAAAAERLMEALKAVAQPLPRFVPAT